MRQLPSPDLQSMGVGENTPPLLFSSDFSHFEMDFGVFLHIFTSIYQGQEILVSVPGERGGDKKMLGGHYLPPTPSPQKNDAPGGGIFEFQEGHISLPGGEVNT